MSEVCGVSLERADAAVMRVAIASLTGTAPPAAKKKPELIKLLVAHFAKDPRKNIPCDQCSGCSDPAVSRACPFCGEDDGAPTDASEAAPAPEPTPAPCDAPTAGEVTPDDDASASGWGAHLGRAALTGAALTAPDDDNGPAMVAGLADRGEVVLLSGPEKISYKTWIALDLVLAVLAGGTWMGRDVVAQSDPALIVSETSAREVKKRLRMLAAGRGVDLEPLADRIVVVSQRVALQGADDLEVSEAPGAPVLRDIMKWQWALVIVDTVRFCMVGDENSSEHSARFSEGARALARDCGALVLCLHHTSKSGEGHRAARGSTELTGGVDAVLTVDAGAKERRMSFALRCRESPEPQAYTLRVEGAAAYVEVVEPPKSSDVADRIVDALKLHPKPMTGRALREAAGGVSGASLTKALDGLARAGRVRAVGAGARRLWMLVPTAAEVFS